MSKYLTVGDLRKMIRGMRDSDPLVMTRCSDFGPMSEVDIYVVEVAVQQGGEYYRLRWTKTFNGKPKEDTLRPGERAVRALYFDGN